MIPLGFTVKRRRSRPRWQIATSVTTTLAALLFLGTPSAAQDQEKPPEEKKETVGVHSKRYRLFAPRPEGWVIAPAPTGAIARFIPADSDGKRVRLDVRVSKQIPESQFQPFLSAFAQTLGPAYEARHAPRESLKEDREGLEQRFVARRVRSGETEPDYLYLFAYRKGSQVVLVLGMSDDGNKAKMLEAAHNLIVNIKAQK